MTVTLHDVALRSGVSRSTASRALSGSPLISAETRVHVEKVALELGYRPNRAASTLRSRQSHLFGLVLTNLYNVSFQTITQVVQRRASTAGYQVILSITDGDPTKESDAIKLMADQGVDGLIVIGTGRSTSITNKLVQDGTAVVNLMRQPVGSAAPSVLASDRDGAHAATAHLLDLGHKRIGFIGGPPGINSGDERYAGYVDALDGRATLDGNLVHRGDFSPEFGATAVEDLVRLEIPMTALLAANHESVFGVLPALVAHRIRVPEELSLICYEDMPWLKAWQPSISVVDSGPGDLGELAMDLLLQQLGRPREGAQDTRVGRTYRVGAELVLRDSCRPATAADPSVSPH